MFWDGERWISSCQSGEVAGMTTASFVKLAQKGGVRSRVYNGARWYALNDVLGLAARKRQRDERKLRIETKIIRPEDSPCASSI
jgi:hypothetical protein